MLESNSFVCFQGLLDAVGFQGGPRAEAEAYHFLRHAAAANGDIVDRVVPAAADEASPSEAIEIYERLYGKHRGEKIVTWRRRF